MKRLLSYACTLLFMATAALGADDAGVNPGSAAALLAKYAALKDALGQSPFKRPLHMTSVEGAGRAAGEIHALVDHPFATAEAAMKKPSQWCDILILHLNTKYCRPSTDGQTTVLQVKVGKKFDQSIDEAYRVDFVYNVAASTANFLQVTLDADEGPLGTRNYRIVLEAAPVDAGKTFIRLSYSYSFGPTGQLAMHAYLATIGRNRVGFTVDGREADGQPHYIGGMRGVIERNTMRYYLAIEAYLGALSAPPQARVETSMRAWFAATEHYPRQLHDMEQGEYLVMKRKEYSRQQTVR